MKNDDFLAIGDIVIDAFIRLKDAEVHCDVNHKDCKLCVAFGAKVPFESVTVVPAVGNSPNASVSAARLGLHSALVTNLGDDDYGKKCLAQLEKDKVDTRFIKKHAGKKTNYHYVLWYNDERTILIKHEEYDYELPDIGEPKWIYLSSLGEHSIPYHEKLAEYLTKHKNINLAFQPGTYQMRFGLEKLKKIYERTEVFFCNVEELRGILSDHDSELSECMKKLQSYGPKIIVTTDGNKGAYLLANGELFFSPTYPDPKPPFERTGAGDAFSSTFVAALALGKEKTEALKWASINSMSVVQKIGAQEGLLTQKEIVAYLEKAPEKFNVRKIF